MIFPCENYKSEHGITNYTFSVKDYVEWGKCDTLNTLCYV